MEETSGAREEKVSSLRQDLINQATLDPGEALVEAQVEKSQLLMIQTEKVEGGGMQVRQGSALLDGVEAEFVGSSNGLSPFDPAPASHILKPKGL
jgi:hypothetical protein